jgi:Pyruvate/2-oxoacid:ferredoxin oxidoreductase gamma subunit
MASAAARVFNIASLDSIVGALGEYFRGKLLEVNVEAAKKPGVRWPRGGFGLRACGS